MIASFNNIINIIVILATVAQRIFVFSFEAEEQGSILEQSQENFKMEILP